MAMGKQLSWRMGQMDLYRNTPSSMAKAYRESAATALVDPHFSPRDRQRRHDHYISEAKKLEGKA